jgi:sulfite exporter TauE/SafE/copper chaperone CopZ
MKKYILHVSGTHCASCKILIEDILGEQEVVRTAEVNLKNQTVLVESYRDITKEELANILTDKIKVHGYTLSPEKEEKQKDLPLQTDDTIWTALPVGLVFLALFFILQKSGILNLGIGGSVTPATSFIIGLIASVSSCLAVVGGLVLSLSATVSEDKDTKIDKKNFTLFHFGRIFSFALLGGLLGVVGNVIGINFTFTAILGIIASVIMLILGLNLVGIFARNKVTLPSGVFNFFRKIEHKTLTPLIIGFATFFLPCGFTQSMQVSALSSGSFMSGMLIMLGFVLGTFPSASLAFFWISILRSF